MKKIAFVKFGGLSAGGTERWLQLMAANLPRDEFQVDFYYCGTAPYIGSDYRHADTDPDRLAFMKQKGVPLIEFKVGAKDITKPTHDWVNTNFWEVFDESRYDLVQTAKAGPKEYPYYLIKRPVVEYVTLSAGVDYSRNIAWTIHVSQWQRKEWARSGGNLARSSVIPIPADPPAARQNLREELGIPSDAVVAGFHQRPDDHIASPIPLNAFKAVQGRDSWFVIMGGGEFYRRQAPELGLERVRFIPASASAERISMFLNTLDVFSHGRKDGETFGTVFAEAMMHGKPCLSHRSDIANAQPETMGPGGLFADTEEGYAQCLSRLLADAGLRQDLGSKGREFAQQNYSLQACVSELSALYRRLFAEPLDKISPRSAIARSLKRRFHGLRGLKIRVIRAIRGLFYARL